MYPETQRWNFSSDDELARAAQSTIVRLYSDQTRALLSARARAPAGAHMRMVKNNTFTEWIVRTKTVRERFLPSTYVVRFSIDSGDREVDVGTWVRLMPEHKRDVHALPIDTKAKKEDTEKQPPKDKLSLTAHLLEEFAAGHLASINPEDVVPYLKKKLSWQIYAVSVI